MKKSIVIVISVFMISVLGSNLMAQGQERAEMRQEYVAQLKQKLNLSDDQEKKLNDIMQTHRKELKAKMNANPEMTKQEHMQIMKTQWEQTQQKIMAILNTEQQQIFKTEMNSLKEKRQEKMKQKRGGKKQGSGKSKATEKVNEEQ